MTHLVMLVVGIGLAWSCRTLAAPVRGPWSKRWQHALTAFLLSPLLLLITALAVIWMGPQGQMAGHWQGWISDALAWGFLAGAGLLLGWLLWDGWQTLRQIHTFALTHRSGLSLRVLPTSALFAAQIGYWHPDLVVSHGLLHRLSPAHLQTILTHEQAHRHYRDTFWFFWLGWIRRLTFWLPHSADLWQELVTLRELRADSWAAQRVDPLLLAESLLQVVSDPSTGGDPLWVEWAPSVAAVDGEDNPCRLVERVDALLANPVLPTPLDLRAWMTLLPAFLPLLVVPFHA
jgi:hypothetical protein